MKVSGMGWRSEEGSKTISTINNPCKYDVPGKVKCYHSLLIFTVEKSSHLHYQTLNTQNDAFVPTVCQGFKLWTNISIIDIVSKHPKAPVFMAKSSIS